MSRTVKAVLGIVVVLGVSTGAWAAPLSIVVDDHDLQPNQAGQPIRIYVEGIGVQVQGLEFNVRIGGGTAGPTFENVNILSPGSGTIFESNNTGINPGSYINSWDAYQGTTTSSGNVSIDGLAPQLLAILTVDTTGLYDGEHYTLSLIDTLEGKTNFAGVVDVDITDGWIHIVPEPTSLMLILAGSGLLIRRRRNKNRH